MVIVAVIVIGGTVAMAVLGDVALMVANTGCSTGSRDADGCQTIYGVVTNFNETQDMWTWFERCYRRKLSQLVMVQLKIVVVVGNIAIGAGVTGQRLTRGSTMTF